MDNAIFRFPKPINEPGYTSGNWRKRDPYG